MGAPSHGTSREVQVGWRERLMPREPVFLALAGAALATAVVLALVAASLGFPGQGSAGAWGLAIASSVSMLAAFVLVARSFAGWRPALLYGGLAYLWWLPLLWVQWLLGDGVPVDAGGVLRNALMWPNWVVQGTLACPLGLPCPLGR